MAHYTEHNAVVGDRQLLMQVICSVRSFARGCQCIYMYILFFYYNESSLDGPFLPWILLMYSW